MDARIGFLSIGHKDYVNGVSRIFVEEAVKNLENKGIEIFFCERSLTDIITAQSEAKKIAREDVDGVIIFLETWIECSVAIAAIRMIEHLPFLVWGFPMFVNEKGVKDQTGSLVAYSVLKGSLDRVGYRYKGIIGGVNDKRVIDKVVSFCKSAFAFQRLKESRIGLVGYASMSMYPGTFDHLLLRRFIGPEVIHFDTYHLIKEEELVNDKDCLGIINKLKAEVRMSESVKEVHLFKAIRLYKALKNMIEKYALNAVTIKCQYELSKTFGITACVPLSLIADEGVVSGCEGDIPTLVSMLMFSYITNQPIFYGDILDIEDNSVLFSSCGFAPFSLSARGKERYIKNFSELVDPMALGKDFKKGDDSFCAFKGIVSSVTLRPGKVTFGRLFEKVGSYGFVYSIGKSVETELRQGIMPATRVIIDGSIERFINLLPSQHYALCYGDISEEIEDLCRILDIELVRI